MLRPGWYRGVARATVITLILGPSAACQSSDPEETVSDTTPRFGSDRDALRSEDRPLVTGRGRFTDDVHVPGEAQAVFVRAQVAHAELRRVDAAAALTMPGVLAVLTGRDLAADGLGAIPPAVTFPGRGGRPMVAAPMPPLAVDRVRYVGEAVAVVVAETLGQAQDAAEAVAVDLAELPAASDVERALAPGARPLWPSAPDNVAFDWTDGDAAAVEVAFARAAHVARVRLLDTRLAPSALEPRAAIGQWDAATGRRLKSFTTPMISIGVGVSGRLPRPRRAPIGLRPSK